jgi:hypothetical protein
MLQDIWVTRPTGQVSASFSLEPQLALRQTGDLEYDGETMLVVHATPERDRPGYIAFGPYRPLPRGEYLVRFELAAAPHDLYQPIAYVDISHSGGDVVASRVITAADVPPEHDYQTITIPIVIDRDVHLVETRVYWTGNGNLWFKRASVTPTQVVDPGTLESVPWTATWLLGAIFVGLLLTSACRAHAEPGSSALAADAATEWAPDETAQRR